MSISNFVSVELEKIAKNEGFIEYVIEQEPGSKHGDGFIAKMLAVTLVGKRKIGGKIVDSKLHLMCKLLPENQDRRDLFDSSSIFEHEIYVYNKILSVFDEFQSEKNIPMGDRFTEYPKCFATASDMDKGEHVIIMENLKSIEYSLWDKRIPVDYATVCLYMEALGKLHAISFALRDQKPDVFNEISRFDDVLVKLFTRDDKMKGLLDGGLDKGLSHLDQPDEKKIMADLKINCVEETIRLLSKDLAGKFYVIGHGDSWNNNLFYSNEGQSTPQRIALLDWQVSRCASPGLDISYYLMSSTNKQVRERYYDLLQVYHNSLSNLMLKLGSDPDKWFTFDDLIGQMKTVGKFGVIMAPTLLEVLVSDPKNIVDLDDITKDSKTVTEFATLDASESKLYKERLRDVIKDAVRFGWV
ncbi:uncharacterized protein LOC119085789 isoform X2 [Bradysia coprophila]|uniref:uncharacterized protein LOC119085789 isoform X2 n=1 Tax=Bradysia coprophila TaxID=38358 RepID=UPI00187D8F81|nr:uncharacterized protein LOC119085789 isoform X2 [Bradysia coprophila]